ncbi:hypothetical protein AVEN_80721-1 [Araneus ventricosus]|uniref:Uncharacterized protein n=1 Tax=Araneus ventricosus TaxID=182803 RepID=A0A4Y2GY08_ARAVE|nr:hypothetical protein AVEN_80721-1 [Araneus ventricosus]
MALEHFVVGRGTSFPRRSSEYSECRIWGTAILMLCMNSLHPDYITVCCGFTADFLLGSFFFEENTPHGPQRCSIKGSRHYDLLQQQVIPALQERECLETTILIQDGVPLHVTLPEQALLRVHFGVNLVFSRSFPTASPSHSPDMNPCDFWLWGFL